MTPIASAGLRIGVAVMDPPPVGPAAAAAAIEGPAFELDEDEPVNTGEDRVDSEGGAAG